MYACLGLNKSDMAQRSSVKHASEGRFEAYLLLSKGDIYLLQDACIIQRRDLDAALPI